ncbi:ATP-dependent DNA helicase RecG [Aerococcus urinae]
MTSITDPVSVLTGVGPKKAALLKRLKIESIYDLLCQFPFRYEDLSVKSIQELADNQKATLKGRVVTEPVVNYFRGLKGNRLHFRLQVDHEIINVNFFNQAYLKKQIHSQEEILIYGTYEAKRQQLLGIKLINFSSEDNETASVYHTTKGLSQSALRQLIKTALDQYEDQIPELIPEELSRRYQLIPHRQAIRLMHFPNTEADSQHARRQIKYQELFLYSLRIQWRKLNQRYQEAGVQILYDNDQLKEFIRSIPFELTQGQKEVTNQICRDLLRPYPMNRLLQGDVGSGKTIVALIALAAAVSAGFQGALMVPTEILAEQHFKEAQSIYQATGLRCALLTGSTKGKERKQILAQLAQGDLDLMIGTHALFQEDVHFKDLGLVIIDEQHRFGVKQRRQLIDKNTDRHPNVLYMTATPIPRTLEITLMGDMEVSKLKELPAGRQPVKTLWLRPQEASQVDYLLKQELAKGRQAYIICPLVGESEKVEAQNAEKIYADYQARFGDHYQVGLLHGQLSNEEKEAVMQAYSDNTIQLLVATTVVEVGVNVPNASLMVILDADHFGLAQLHQLRGRVGRGQAASFCLLLADPHTENGKERMRIMTESNDGFYLSQQDLELRGAGDYFGTKQSGLPEFHLADPVEDGEILEYSRQDAIQFAPYLMENAQDYPLLGAWLNQVEEERQA